MIAKRLLLIVGLLLAGTPVSAQWITQNGISATRFPIRLIPITQPTSAQAAQEGTFYYDSAAHVFKVYNGTAWVAIGSVTTTGLGTTSTDGIVLQNTTPATGSVTVQMSPRVKWCGTAWNSTAGASEIDCFAAEVLPATVAGTTTAAWHLLKSINAGAFSSIFNVNDGGTVTASGNVNLSSSASLGFASTGFLTAGGANGRFLLRDTTVAAGVGIDIATDATMKVLTRAFADTATITANVLKPTSPIITAGTDDTTTQTGDVTRVRYQATITPASGGAGNCATQAAGFKAASTNADCVIATLPAGTRLIAAYADVTAGFTCSGTCSGTKVFRLGISAGGVEVFATSLNVAITATYGLADADMGSGMTRAAQIQGAYTPSWSATTTLTARFTSGTGNWGDAAATFVNAGSIKFTLITELAK